MRTIAIVLMLVGGGAIVTTLMGVHVEYFDWMNNWGLLFGWVIRVGLFLFGTMVWGLRSTTG